MDEVVSTARLAHLLGASAKSIAAWSASGVVTKVSHGRYDLRASIAGYLKHKLSVAAGRGPLDATASVASARQRLLKLQADRVELQMKAESGELVELAMVAATVNVMLRGIRSQFLALPARLGARLPLSREGVSIAYEEVCDIMNDCAHVLRWEVPDSLVDAARRAIEAEVGKEGDGEPKRRRA